MSISRKRNRRDGFTLIEVLLVLVILVILVSLVVGTYRNTQQKAMIRAARAQVGLFETPLETYHLDLNAYPATANGLEALRQAPGDLANPARWGGPYLDKNIPADPWDQPYQYESPGRNNPDSYDIWSMGPDLADGTEDDIGNWSRQQ